MTLESCWSINCLARRQPGDNGTEETLISGSACDIIIGGTKLGNPVHGLVILEAGVDFIVSAIAW